MRGKGHLENQGGVAFLNFESFHWRLEQPAGAELGLGQPGVGCHFWEEEGKGQPRQLYVALSADSFCAALRKFSYDREVLSWRLQQTLGKSDLWERGGEWGAEEVLETHGLEEELLQRLEEVGK